MSPEPQTEADYDPELLAELAGFKARVDLDDLATTIIGFSIAAFGVLAAREHQSIGDSTDREAGVFAEVFTYYLTLALLCLAEALHLKDALLPLIGEELNERCIMLTGESAALSSFVKQTLERDAFRIVVSQYLSAAEGATTTKSERGKQLAALVGFEPKRHDVLDGAVIASCVRILSSMGEEVAEGKRAQIRDVWAAHRTFSDRFRAKLKGKLGQGSSR